MIHVSSENAQRYDRVKRKGVTFLAGLFRTKRFLVGMKMQEGHDIEREARDEAPAVLTNNCRRNGQDIESTVSRIPSTLSVTAVDVVVAPTACHPSPSHSILTLTPGRTRNIDQDMEALRLSRQDNPFLQVLASRESLVESIEESESDDAILMSQELGDADPLTLAQVHEHLVRSPPPASWPHTPIFHFPHRNTTSGKVESIVGSHYKSPSKSPAHHRGGTDDDELSRSEPSTDIRDRHTHSFSLLNPTPIRTLSEVRRLHRSADDSVQLMSSEISATFSSFKRGGSSLLDSVKGKFDGESGQMLDHGRSSVKSSSIKDNKRRWKISEIGSITRKGFSKSREPSTVTEPKIETIGKHSNISILPMKNKTKNVGKELHVFKNAKPKAESSLEFSNDGSISIVENRPKNLQNNAESRGPEEDENTEEQRKSWINSEPAKIIEETDTVSIRTKKMIPDPIMNTEQQEVPQTSIVDEGKQIEEGIEKNDKLEKISIIEELITKDEPTKYEIVNISRKNFDKMTKNLDNGEILRVNHKTLPPSLENVFILPVEKEDPHGEWRNLPLPLIKEIRRLTKPKRAHNCPKACPCVFTQELIAIYHRAKELSKRAEKTSKIKYHCTFRMTKSEINFFKEDARMCSAMIGEAKTRRAEMRELMDMWQEANEKMTVRKKEIVSIVANIDSTTKATNEIENLLKDWLPNGKMEKLRKTQRIMEKEDKERMEMLEDQERTFGKEKIEEILQKREIWLEEERVREEKRKNQRTQGLLCLENATNLMQKYIDERKSLLNR